MPLEPVPEEEVETQQPAPSSPSVLPPKTSAAAERDSFYDTSYAMFAALIFLSLYS
jgi:hypothetical protein